MKSQIDLFSFSDCDTTLSIGDFTFTFEFSARMKMSWNARKKGKSFTLRVPKVVQKGDRSLCQTFCRWAMISYDKRRASSKSERKELESLIFVEIENLLQIHGLDRPSKERSFNEQGNTHDLKKIFDEVNQEYFAGSVDAKITWSSRVGGTSFHSQRIDGKGNKYHLISISKGYDNSNCPVYAVKGVVYHEMLHIVIPPEIINGRRVVHSRKFREAEKKYSHYREWITWHGLFLRKNINALKKNK